MIAATQPQAAFAAFTKSLQFQWAYVQCVVPNYQSLFKDLETVISEKFLPTVIGVEVSQAECNLLFLPARWGSLGVSNTVNTSFLTYRQVTDMIVQSIKSNKAFELDAHESLLRETRTEAVRAKEESYGSKFSNILGHFDPAHQRAITRAMNEKVSGWLTVLALAKSHFDLSAQEFWDAPAIRYRRPLRGIPDLCDGCSSPFSLSHALSCRKGGLVIHRHNEVCYAIGDLASFV